MDRQQYETEREKLLDELRRAGAKGPSLKFPKITLIDELQAEREYTEQIGGLRDWLEDLRNL